MTILSTIGICLLVVGYLILAWVFFDRTMKAGKKEINEFLKVSPFPYSSTVMREELESGLTVSSIMFGLFWPLALIFVGVSKLFGKVLSRYN